MISVHFDEPHRPTEQQTRLLNLLVRQAADYLERKRAEQIEEILFARCNIGATICLR